jgi:hypothetical protein
MEADGQPVAERATVTAYAPLISVIMDGRPDDYPGTPHFGT